MERDPVRWLYDLQHFGIKLGLDNIRQLLERLGRPDAGFLTVLVGGTNGKGSVAAMLAAMLDAHGLRSGLFTSPHLVRPEERIRLAGREVETAELHRRLRHLRRVVEEGRECGALAAHPSFFEVITATALCAFREHAVDVGVLEVGLGGRLDATNAVDARVSVVVTVELDHRKTLGPTLVDIAGEKAGIVKPGRPLVAGAVQPEALRVLARVCRERGAPLLETSRVVAVEDRGPGSFDLSTPRGAYRDLRSSLAGQHQRHNAAVALLALETLLEELGRTPDAEAVRHGLSRVRWPARLEWREERPPMLLDGAHNPAGARALAAYLDALRRAGGALPGAPGPAVGGRPVLLFGAMRGKDLPGILKPLAGRVTCGIVTRPGLDRSADPDEVAAVAREHLEAVELVREPAGALELARRRAGPGGWILVAGSLYLIGQVLGLLERRPTPGPLAM